MRAIVTDMALDKSIRIQYKYPAGVIVVAIKLYGHSLAAISDQDATEYNPEQGVNSAFEQEVSIMSSLQNHPSIAVLIGFM